MALRRYSKTPQLGLGKYFGTTRALERIRSGISQGTIGYTASTLKEGDRLDIVAGRAYGDASLWWVIAAASNIGWVGQVPPGTLIRIPMLSDVMAAM